MLVAEDVPGDKVEIADVNVPSSAYLQWFATSLKSHALTLEDGGYTRKCC